MYRDETNKISAQEGGRMEKGHSILLSAKAFNAG